MRRNHVVQSRMSDAEYAALCEKANSVERSISDYVRSSIALVQIHRIEQLSPLIEEMHHLRMELNGLTTKCHQGIMHHVDLTTIEA
ncbi:plasmid mobilization protein [Eubacterium aggregans]|uniref:plasmid mobilization protein n=1 Tax=Eubacterium aggregans TaxID=81409 RepID=UPI003F361F87